MSSRPSDRLRFAATRRRANQLVREHDTVRERTLEITFLELGAEAYAFTFG
jgi:hypothetical protein